MALPRVDIVRLNGAVLLFALAISLVTGLVFGIIPAFRASDVDLRQDLTKTAGHDALTFASVTVLIVVVALVASLVPALRAARVDPLAAIRIE